MTRTDTILLLAAKSINAIKFLLAVIVVIILASVPVDVSAQGGGSVYIVGGAYYKTPSQAFQMPKTEIGSRCGLAHITMSAYSKRAMSRWLASVADPELIVKARFLTGVGYG